MANHTGGYFRKREENLMKWVSYWRNNPHRFIEDYLGVKLFFFQKILIYMINKHPYFMYIAARGQGKSYLIAIYVVARCILYPGSKIVLASGVKNQARLIISEKIVDLYNKSSALRGEIGDYRNISTGVNAAEVVFKNGSKISATASSDNSRGLRGNILIVDEFRLVDKDIVDKVLKPMLNVSRIPEFKLKNMLKYKDYNEDNVEIYISSAWYKSHWSWAEFNEFLNKMLKDNSNFVVSIPYQASVFHDLLKQERVDNEKLKDSFDENGYKMEFDGVFLGVNERGYFKLEPINESRTLAKTFRPPKDLEYVENKRLSKPKKLSNMERRAGEIRMVSLDVALQGGSKTVKNDTAAFVCLRLLPSKDNTFTRHMVYLESIRDNIETKNLAIRLKQLYYDFEADYAILDANGNGLGVYDSLADTLYDEKRDEEYEPWTSINDEELQQRFKNNEGKPVLYTYKGASKINNDIAVSLKTAFNNGKLKLPMNDIQKKDDFVANERMKFLSLSADEKNELMTVYVQTTALVNELVSLEYELKDGGNIKIKEVGSTTKDRYSALSYANHRAQELEREMQDNVEVNDLGSYFFINNNFKQ